MSGSYVNMYLKIRFLCTVFAYLPDMVPEYFRGTDVMMISLSSDTETRTCRRGEQNFLNFQFFGEFLIIFSGGCGTYSPSMYLPQSQSLEAVRGIIIRLIHNAPNDP